MTTQSHSRSDRSRRDLHAEITNRLIAAIEADPGHPQLPWRRSSTPLWMPVNALSHKAYNGINVVNLWVAAEVRGFTSPHWATLKQWREAGCQVRKGAKAELVVFYKQYDVEPSADDESDDGKRRVARASYVFNAGEVDGFVPPDAAPTLGPIERMAAADCFIAATRACIEHGGDRAFYRPVTDHIQMPDEGLFTGTDTMTRDESYFAVLLHELTHWTMHKDRCDRQLDKRFGKEAYAAEELVALSGQSGCGLSGQSGATRTDL